MKDISWINNIKWRFSIGKAGNGNVSPYKYMELLGFNKAGVIVDGQPAHLHLGALVRAAGKPHVGDLLDDQPRTGRQPAEQPPELRRRHLPEGDDRHVRHRSRAAGRDGYSGALQGNNADMRTRGFEVSLGWTDSFRMANKPFNYSVRLSLWDSKSIITKYTSKSNTCPRSTPTPTTKAWSW